MKQDWKSKADEYLSISNKYKLGDLPTERPHLKTHGLSGLSKNNLIKAISILNEIDIDCIEDLHRNLKKTEPLKNEIQSTLRSGGRVFLCGCGATGRLALTLERIYLEENPGRTNVKSFMAGGDVALISSIEKFEDYTKWGGRQLDDLNFGENDLLIGSSEGGETPWVIGAVEHASLVSKRKPWFLYCNPEKLLKDTVKRSKIILENPNIESINMFCGEMALAGSTRMQASTVLTLGIGIPLIYHEKNYKDIEDDFKKFILTYKNINIDNILNLVKSESEIYQNGGFCQYQCDSHLGISILTDTTERSPTFSLSPFENHDEDTTNPSLCYFSFSHISDNNIAWEFLLGRKPRTVEWDEVKAKSSMFRLNGYEISSKNLELRNNYLKFKESVFTVRLLKNSLEFQLDENNYNFNLDTDQNLYIHVLLKMILNIHSTLVMGRLDRYESNIMTWVKSSNNKLIDRSARNIDYLLKEMGLNFSYQEIVYKIFEKSEDLRPNQSIVLECVNALSVK